MVTRDVLKVLKLHSPAARAILRTFKTSLVPINHEMHSRSYDFLYLSPNSYASYIGGFAISAKNHLAKRHLFAHLMPEVLTKHEPSMLKHLHEFSYSKY